MIVLQGIVGSKAYGLQRPDSDTDRLGVYYAPTESFLGLNPPSPKTSTLVDHEPEDLTLHEVGKFCTLALQCNPTILELLWLPDELYETRHPFGSELISLRDNFLSRDRVKSAYFGYAYEQFLRLTNRSRFPDVPVNRIEKHARHLMRLLHQGFELYVHGTMSVRVQYPKTYHDFGRAVGAGDIEWPARLIRHYRTMFENAESNLPELPRRDTVEEFLRSTRKELM